MTNSNPRLSKEQVLETFTKIVAQSLQINPSQITADSYLDDLDADSLDLLEIMVNTEEEFDISMPEKSVLKTAEGVFGTDVLVKEGVLTGTGREFLLRRMPDLDEEQLQDPVKIHEVDHLFTRVSSWVRMIQELMEHTPRECPQCGTEFGKSVAALFKCVKCGEECDIPSGEELNKRWVEEYHNNEYRPLQASSSASSDLSDLSEEGSKGNLSPLEGVPEEKT